MNKIIQIVLLFMPLFGFSQKDTIAHLYTFGSLANDLGEDISATSDGGFIVVGSTASSGDGNTDVYLLKIDSLCNKEWSWALGGLNNDWGYAVKQTYDNGYIIAATSNSFGNGGYDAMLLKRDSFGNYEWQKTYGGNDWDFAYDVVQTFDSGFVFCGETYNNSNGYADVYVVKTNSIGDTIWTRTVGGSLIDKGNALIQTSDSNIVVAGFKNTVSDSTQAYVLKFDKNGVLLWDSAYGGMGYEKLNCVYENSSGNYSFAGATTSNSGGDLNYYILNLNQQGVLLWDFTIVNGPIPTPDDDEVFTIGELSDSKILFVGYSKTGGLSKNIALFSLTQFGGWGGDATVINTNNDEVINNIIINQNNKIVGVGESNSYGFGNKDVLVIKLDTIVPTQPIQLVVNEDIAPITVNENNSTSFICIYPNIASEYINIPDLMYSRINQIEIINIEGQVIRKMRLDQNRMDITTLKNGVYIVVFRFNDGSIGYSKIIKV